MRSASRQLPYADRVVILLAVKFGCNISSDTERRIRTNERARVVDYLQALGISAISRHASHRRTETRRYTRALDLLVDVRLDERRLIVRELRREAKISWRIIACVGIAPERSFGTPWSRAMVRTGPAAGFFSPRAFNRNQLRGVRCGLPRSAPFEICAVWQRRHVRCRDSP